MSRNTPSVTPPQVVSGRGGGITAREMNRALIAAHGDAQAQRFGRWTEEPLGFVDLPWMLQALITRVEPATYDDSAPPFPADVYYWIHAVGVPDAKLERVRPAYGRPANGLVARIFPARVGDICGLVRVVSPVGIRRGEMFVFTEEVARRRCSTTPTPPPPVPGGNNPNPGTRPTPPFPTRPPRPTDPFSNPPIPVY